MEAEMIVFITCQAFFSLKIGFDCSPDTIAFNEEKFFSTRNSLKKIGIDGCSDEMHCSSQGRNNRETLNHALITGALCLFV